MNEDREFHGWVPDVRLDGYLCETHNCLVIRIVLLDCELTPRRQASVLAEDAPAYP